jgi:hypothetical protein
MNDSAETLKAEDLIHINDQEMYSDYCEDYEEYKQKRIRDRANDMAVTLGEAFFQIIAISRHHANPEVRRLAQGLLDHLYKVDEETYSARKYGKYHSRNADLPPEMMRLSKRGQTPRLSTI